MTERSLAFFFRFRFSSHLFRLLGSGSYFSIFVSVSVFFFSIFLSLSLNFFLQFCFLIHFLTRFASVSLLFRFTVFLYVHLSLFFYDTLFHFRLHGLSFSYSFFTLFVQKDSSLFQSFLHVSPLSIGVRCTRCQLLMISSLLLIISI